MTSDIAAGPTLSRLVFFLYRFCRDLHSKFHFHIGLVSVLYRFAHLTSFSPKISLPSTSPKQKLIKANLNAPLQKPEQNQFLLWILYRSEAPIQKVKSEGHHRQSDRFLPPRNTNNNDFCFGFCIGFISVWKLLSRISNLKIIEASVRAPTQESRQREFSL